LILNRIQLAAALQGKLTDEERQRVEELLLIEDIKQAIAEKDVDKAEKLLDELNKVRTETEALSRIIIRFRSRQPIL
jgi:Mg/Co/Ni transporter MgtE